MIPVVDARSGTGELSAATQPNSTIRKEPPMRHAAPHNNSLDRRLNRTGQLIFAGIAYTIAGLATCLITLGSALTIWGLWQWLGVN